MLAAMRIIAIVLSHLGVILTAKGLGYVGGFWSGEATGIWSGLICLVIGGVLAYISIKRRRQLRK